MKCDWPYDFFIGLGLALFALEVTYLIIWILN